MKTTVRFVIAIIVIAVAVYFLIALGEDGAGTDAPDDTPDAAIASEEEAGETDPAADRPGTSGNNAAPEAPLDPVSEPEGDEFDLLGGDPPEDTSPPR